MRSPGLILRARRDSDPRHLPCRRHSDPLTRDYVPNNLSKYIDRVRSGEEVVVTDRGKPVARLSAIDSSTDRIADLVAAGVVRAPTRSARHRPHRRIKAKGPVSDLVAEQRR